MKKLFTRLFTVTVLVTFLSSLTARAEDNLLFDPGFEDPWVTNNFGTFPSQDAWDSNGTSKETIIFHSGATACKITGSAMAKLEQYTGLLTLTAGDHYELSFYYYVVTSLGTNSDIRMNNYWGGGNVDATHEESILKEQFSATTTGVWETKTLALTVPANASSFYLALKVPLGATVIFDDFDLHKVVSNEPTLTVTPASVPAFATTINVQTTKQVSVTTANLPYDVNVEITGANAGYFDVSASLIPAGQTSISLDVHYLPTQTGNHEAMLTFDCPDAPELFTSRRLNGTATDPTAQPVITILPVSHDFGTLTVGQDSIMAFTVTTENLSTLPSRAMIDDGTPNGAFILISGEPVKNGTSTLRIRFKPVEAGTFTKQLRISADGISATANLTGIGVGTIAPPETEGDSLPLDNSNALAEMEENFNSVTHNTALSLPQWKNIAEQNYRAWWGFRFDEEPNFAAKVTAYNSVNTAPDAYEMWLYTPPLDFINATSKEFSFKVMGDFMSDADEARLKVYYVENDEPLYKEELQGLDIPQGSDYNGTWVPYIMDLAGQNIADTFFIAFHFIAPHGGTQSATVYYIDDVTWGKKVSAVTATQYDTDRIWTQQGTLHIRSEESGKVILYDISGIILGEYSFAAGENTIPTRLQSGVYIVQIQHGDYRKNCKITVMPV